MRWDTVGCRSRAVVVVAVAVRICCRYMCTCWLPSTGAGTELRRDMARGISSPRTHSQRQRPAGQPASSQLAVARGVVLDYYSLEADSATHDDMNGSRSRSVRLEGDEQQQLYVLRLRCTEASWQGVDRHGRLHSAPTERLCLNHHFRPLWFSPDVIARPRSQALF